MGGQHKKKLRAEKAKVKLKGAKLPKGLNVTKTEFKVRKIALREQLKDTHFVDGSRQINLKECLSKLKHHSSNYRTESLRILRDAVSINHVGIMGCLSELVQGISAICLDQERDSRRESFKTLSVLLGFLPTETVAPFFHIISSYLRCAMTHIQPSIQEDSLLLLDVLLQHVPNLVATHSAKILHNFLEMISRVRAEGDKAGRVLTVNMGQKQTTIKWRSKVLLRLQQMLVTLAEFRRKQNEETASENTKSTALVSYGTKTIQHYGVKRNFDTSQSCDLSSIFNRSFAGSITTSDDADVDESEKLRSYVEHLMPLLLESWLEVRPQKTSNSRSFETLITPDAALTLKIVLEIIENLWILIEIYEMQANNNELSLWLKYQYADVFAANFLQTSYPYQQIEFDDDNHSKKKAKRSSTSLSPFCLQQNITIAFLMCRFYSNDIDAQTKNFNAVLSYLTSVVGSICSQASPEYLRPLVSALRALLLECGSTLAHLHKEPVTLLLQGCIQAFLENKFGELGISSKILIMLCEIVQHNELCTAYGEQEFVDFLNYLPQLLLKPMVNESCLLSMSKLGKQQNMVFLDALRKVLPDVVQHLQSIQVTGSHNVFEGKKHIINLFFWLNPQQSIAKSEQERILNAVDANVTDKRVSGYCRYILTVL